MFLSATSVSLTQTSVFGVREKKRIAAFWCCGVYAPLCLYSRGQTQRRGLFVLPSSFYSLHHLSRREAMKAVFFIYLLFFYTSRPPFHPTKSVSCSPLRRADQIFEADADAARTGRMKNTDSKTGFCFCFFLINTQ